MLPHTHVRREQYLRPKVLRGRCVVTSHVLLRLWALDYECGPVPGEAALHDIALRDAIRHVLLTTGIYIYTQFLNLLRSKTWQMSAFFRGIAT